MPVDLSLAVQHEFVLHLSDDANILDTSPYEDLDPGTDDDAILDTYTHEELDSGSACPEVYALAADIGELLQTLDRVGRDDSKSCPQCVVGSRHSVW